MWPYVNKYSKGNKTQVIVIHCAPTRGEGWGIDWPMCRESNMVMISLIFTQFLLFIVPRGGGKRAGLLLFNCPRS